MIDIILNEYEWMESILERLDESYKTPSVINRYARYLYEKGYRKDGLQKELERFLIRCDPSVNLVAWQSIIDYAVKNAGSRPLIKLDGVWITKNEMDKIDALDGWMARRLMFTAVGLAKYYNAVNEKNNNWVSIDIKDIFNMANIKLPRKRQALMINKLWELGYIGYSRAVDNTNINVRIIDDSSEKEILITDFRNLGNRYMLIKDQGYMECSECGLVVRRSACAQKYCRDCAEKIHKQNSAEAYRNSVA